MLAGVSGGDRARARHRDRLHRPAGRGADLARRDRARAAVATGAMGADRRQSGSSPSASIFGAHIEAACPGVLVVLVLVALTAMAFGTLGAALALSAGSAERRAGHLPARVRDPVPVVGVLPARPAARAGARRSRDWNPMSLIADGLRDPIISGLAPRPTLEGARRRSRSSRRSASALCGRGAAQEAATEA